VELFLLLIGSLLALVEAFLIYKAVRNTRRAHLLTRLPWSRLDDLQPGLVKVEGQAAATRDILRSPLADRACVYFHFLVQEKRQRGGAPPHGGGAFWKTVIDDAQSVPCVIENGAGSAFCRLESAELVLHIDNEERSGFLNDARPELQLMLQEQYIYSTVGLIFNRTLYYRESRIEAGDALVVLGTAWQRPDNAWELVRGAGPLIVSNQGLATVRASYRNAAIGWWCLVVLALLPVGVALAILW
jgi:hypothetical protein